MSSCRLRRAEYRATGVPSARGGNAVGPPSLSREKWCACKRYVPAVKSGVAVLFRCEADSNVRMWEAN
jgi:hypothetical protein